MSEKSKKIYALVSGGVLQNVWGADPDMEVVLIDEDDGDCDEQVKADNDAGIAKIDKEVKEGRLHMIF